MMSGIIGRLFREFSVTIAMTIAVSAFVSLTLTPMMASRFLKSRDEERHGRLYRLSEKGFTALANGYARGVDFVLRHRFATLLTFFATVIATGYLFVVIPKGFFPQQDTGILFGTTEAAQDVSFAAMYKLQEEAGEDRHGRSGGRNDGDGAWHRHRQFGAEQRPHVHHAQAAGGARRKRISGDRAATAEAGADPGIQGLSCRRRRT